MSLDLIGFLKKVYSVWLSEHLEAFALHSLDCTDSLTLRKQTHVHSTMQLVKQLKQPFALVKDQSFEEQWTSLSSPVRY